MIYVLDTYPLFTLRNFSKWMLYIFESLHYLSYRGSIILTSVLKTAGWGWGMDSY